MFNLANNPSDTINAIARQKGEQLKDIRNDILHFPIDTNVKNLTNSQSYIKDFIDKARNGSDANNKDFTTDLRFPVYMVDPIYLFKIELKDVDIVREAEKKDVIPLDAGFFDSTAEGRLLPRINGAYLHNGGIKMSYVEIKDAYAVKSGIFNSHLSRTKIVVIVEILGELLPTTLDHLFLLRENIIEESEYSYDIDGI